jgi:hypothetical protein
MRHQPHVVSPTPASARVLLVSKNFAAIKGISHIGLGVAALNTARTLRAAGIWAEAVPASSSANIRDAIHSKNADASYDRNHPVSHVVVSAPWIPTVELAQLAGEFPDVHFAVVSHSNLGFLQADPNGIKLLREVGDLQLAHHNVALAGNSQKFCSAWEAMYGRKVECLPNLYDCSTIRHVGQRAPWRSGATMRLGVFGAVRPLKNMVTAVAACVHLATSTKADAEIWMNAGRNEGARTIPDAIQQLVTGLKHVSIREVGWATWPQFRSTVAQMNLLVSPSYTESFNMVTADGCAEGVASVVSDAIDWAPADWVACADDASTIARTARRLVQDSHAVTEGQDCLRAYVSRGLQHWRAYLRA